MHFRVYGKINGFVKMTFSKYVYGRKFRETWYGTWQHVGAVRIYPYNTSTMVGWKIIFTIALQNNIENGNHFVLFEKLTGHGA